MKRTIKFQRENSYHPELCRDAATGSETDLCIRYRWSRSRSSLRHSHNRSVEGKTDEFKTCGQIWETGEVIMEKRKEFVHFVCVYFWVSVWQDWKNLLQVCCEFQDCPEPDVGCEWLPASPPSSWDPSSDAPASNRTQPQSSFWGKAGIRSSAADPWRW